MKTQSAGEAWKNALEESKTNLKEEDIKVLKNLSKLLGKTDIDGQLSEIELIEEQITNAEEEQKKNEKLYKSLGILAGIAIAIILI